MPVLVQHFQEHRQLDANVGLLDFLSMHYWGKDRNDNDDDRDRQLPFKEFDGQVQYVLFVPALRFFNVDLDPSFPRVNFPLTRNDFLPDPALSSLFRPPKA